MAPSSVLIVRLSAIGDVIHALPVLTALRQALPKARLGWVVEELSAPLLENHPYLDRLYVIPKKRWKKNFARLYFPEIRPFFREIRREGWEAALDIHGLTKSGLVARACGARIRVGYGDEDGREINKWFTNLKVTPSPAAKHVVERNLCLLEGLGIDPVMDAVGTMGLRAEEKDAMRALLRDAGRDGSAPLLALNPGAGWASKRWAPEKFAATGAALAESDGLVPLVLWGPGEEAARDVIAAALAERGVPHVVAPPTRIRELAVLISLCSLFIGGDTGPTHLAGMLGVPTVSIFGASDGERNRPWPRESGPMIQRTELPCVPCWKTVCPLEGVDRMACLRFLEVETVVAAARETWRARRSG